MFYIRTEKNKYDIEVVIDSSDDEHFVKTSGLEWIEIDTNLRPINGTYFYDGEIISLDSENYHQIEQIIFEKEEPNRVERESNLPEIGEYVEENNIDDRLTFEDDTLNSREKIKEEILKLPKPQLPILDDVESNEENYNIWSENLKNLIITINAYDSGNYTFEDNEVKFNSPIEFSDGTIQEFVIIPLSITLDEQIQFLKDQKENIENLLLRMKEELGIK